MVALNFNSPKAVIPEVSAPDISGRILFTAAQANLLPSDPLFPLVEAISHIPGEVDKRLEPVIRVLAEIASSAEKSRSRPMSDVQFDELSNSILGGCQGWTASFVKASHWQNYTLLLFAFIITASFFFGAGWMIGAPQPKMTCADQNNGARVCWVFTRLPNQVAEK